MNDPESSGGAVPGAEGNGILARLRQWWRRGSAEEEYLAGATDTADLERRMRALERASGGPAVVTFNH